MDCTTFNLARIANAHHGAPKSNNKCSSAATNQPLRIPLSARIADSHRRRHQMSGYSPPRTTSWKYAWNNDSSQQRPTRPGTGKAASERLYNDRGTNRQHREELQRSLASNGPPTDTTKPFVNERSRQLAANRYDKVMAHTVTGRYRKAALAIAKAKGESLNDVYNYGDMLFQDCLLYTSPSPRD